MKLDFSTIKPYSTLVVAGVSEKIAHPRRSTESIARELIAEMRASTDPISAPPEALWRPVAEEIDREIEAGKLNGEIPR